MIGQCTDMDERVRIRRTWLAGEASGRSALLLQFAAGAQPFAASWLPGTAFEGELAFYPGAGMRRALLKGAVSPLPSPTSFSQPWRIAQLLDDEASMLAANPWHERTATVLKAVVPIIRDGHWYLIDGTGHCLPLTRGDHWLWLAVSGGHPHDVAIEWDGKTARPLGLFADGYYHVLTELA